MKLKSKVIEIALRIVIAALTAALTAVTTTSCMGFGPPPPTPPKEGRKPTPKEGRSTTL